MHTHTQAHTDMCVRESLANAHTHTHTHIHASTPAEPVQASLLGGAPGQKGQVMEKVDGDSLVAFSRGTNVAEPHGHVLA